MTPHSAQRGVTLLEAIVALVIIGSAFAAVLEQQAQLTHTLDAVRRAHERAIWRRNAVEVASSLEREADRSGSMSWTGGIALDWRPSADVGQIRNNRIGSRTAGAWTVHLARVNFAVRKEGRTLLQESILVATADPPRVSQEVGAPTLPGQ